MVIKEKNTDNCNEAIAYKDGFYLRARGFGNHLSLTMDNRGSWLYCGGRGGDHRLLNHRGLDQRRDRVTAPYLYVIIHA